MDSCQLHLLVDGLGVDIERTAEDVWESDDIVYLVRIVRASCGHEDIGTACHGLLVGYLRCGVGKREDYWLLCHGAYHVLADNIALGEPEENIRAPHRLLESVDITAVSREESLLRCEVVTVRGDDTL